MKTWKVSDVRWATEADLKLPIWDHWNRKTKLPSGFWQRTWEYPYVQARVPKTASSLDFGGTYPFVLFPCWPNAKSVDIRDLNTIDHNLHKGQWPKEKLIVADATNVPVPDNSFDCAFSISAIEEMPDPLKVMKEMQRIASKRIVLTMDVSEKMGISRVQLQELADHCGFEIPPIPNNVLHSTSEVIQELGLEPKPEYSHIRVLAITLDAVYEEKQVAVLVTHWESLPFLKICVAKFLENASPNTKATMYILDDQSQDGSYEEATRL